MVRKIKVKRFMFLVGVIIIVCVILWIGLCGLGFLGISVSKLKISDLNKSWLKSFLYSLKFLFITEENKANWVAIGAVSVLISYWITIRENTKKIDAELIAKARIEWIQKARDTTAEMITYILKYTQIAKEIDEKKHYKRIRGRGFNRINESYAAINKLILLFGPDDDGCTKETSIDDKETNDFKNELIVEKLKSLKKLLNEEEENLISYRITDTYKAINDQIEELSDIFRIYYKIEWKKVTKIRQ